MGVQLDGDLFALTLKARRGEPLDPYVVEKVAEEAQLHRNAQEADKAVIDHAPLFDQT